MAHHEVKFAVGVKDDGPDPYDHDHDEETDTPCKYHSFEEFLKDHKVSELFVPGRAVIEISSQETPLQGFSKLIDAHILSAPVYDEKSHAYSGFLDVRDMVQFMLSYVEEQKKRAKRVEGSLRCNWHEIITVGTKLHTDATRGMTVSYLSRKHQFHPVSANETLLPVVQTLAKGLHRVPVVDEQGRVKHIISQSSIIQFVAKHAKAIKPLLTATIESTKIGTRPVITVPDSSTAAEVFKTIATKNLSGIGVVDPHGKLVGNTSGSDMKMVLQSPKADLLELSIREYLVEIRRSQAKTTAPIVTVQPSDTLQRVVAKLKATGMHRVFATDSDHRPLAVIAITDVLRALLKTIAA